MTIYYHKYDEACVSSAVASLKFDREQGESSATLYIDHIAVAYLSTYGTLNLLALEVGDGFSGGGDIKDVEYLQSKGILLDKKPHRWNREGYWEYYIKVED